MASHLIFLVGSLRIGRSNSCHLPTDRSPSCVASNGPFGSLCHNMPQTCILHIASGSYRCSCNCRIWWLLRCSPSFLAECSESLFERCGPRLLSAGSSRRLLQARRDGCRNASKGEFASRAISRHPQHGPEVIHRKIEGASRVIAGIAESDSTRMPHEMIYHIDLL